MTINLQRNVSSPDKYKRLRETAMNNNSTLYWRLIDNVYCKGSYKSH